MFIVKSLFNQTRDGVVLFCFHFSIKKWKDFILPTEHRTESFYSYDILTKHYPSFPEMNVHWLLSGGMKRNVPTFQTHSLHSFGGGVPTKFISRSCISNEPQPNQGATHKKKSSPSGIGPTTPSLIFLLGSLPLCAVVRSRPWASAFPPPPSSTRCSSGLARGRGGAPATSPPPISSMVDSEKFPSIHKP
jgi:hypothetical protein